MPKLEAVRIPKRQPLKSSIYIDAGLAKIVRKIASEEGRHLSNVVNDMLVSYLKEVHPKWKLDFGSAPGGEVG